MSNAKPSKEQIERRERRVRQGGMDGERRQLEIAAGEKRPGVVYRWINGDKARVEKMTTGAGDWMVDPDIAPRYVGTDSQGKPMMAYAVHKPEEWYAEDQQKKQAELEAHTQRSAPVGDGQYGSPIVDNQSAYAAGGSVRPV